MVAVIEPTVLSYEAPSYYKPWSVNELTNTPRGNAIRTRQKNAWRDVTIAAAADIGPLPPCNVHVTIPFARRMTRRDPHNYTGTVVKVIVDALVKAGCWPDDNPTFVTVIEPSFSVGTTIRVELTPREA